MATLQKIRSKGPLLVIVIGLALFAFIAGDAWKVLAPHQKTDAGKIYGEAISAQDFQKLVDEYTTVIKFTSGNTSLTDEQVTQLKDEVWRNYVNNKLIEHEADKLGLTVSKAELEDIINKGTDQMLRQTPFVNQQTGMFDKDLLKKFLADYAKMDKNKLPQQYAEYYENLYTFWKFVEKNLKQNKLAEKYQNLISHSLISNPVEAKAAFEARTQSSDFLVAAIPYSSISDSEIKVSDSEIQNLYTKKKEQFKQYVESRSIKYIDVQVKASKNDRAAIDKEMATAKNNLLKGGDYGAIVRNAETMFPYLDLPYTKEALPKDIQGKIDSVSVGSVCGPFYTLQDNTLNTFKLLGKVLQTDSIKFRQIQIQAGTPAKTKQIADSVFKAVQNGADFATLAKKYKGTAEGQWVTSQAYEGQATMDANSIKLFGTLFNLGKDQSANIALSQGNIIIQVMDKKADKPKYNVALIKKQVAFSKDTYNQAYNKFSQFIAANPTLDKLTAHAEEKGYKLLERNDLYSAEHNVAGVTNTKEVMKWIYSAKEGDVSTLFECGNNDHMMVVALSNIVKDGYRPLTLVKNQLKAEIIRDKKADKIKTMINEKHFTSFDQLKTLKGVVTDTIKHVTFAAPTYVTSLNASEPVISAYAGIAQLNKLTQPIKGNAAVYVLLPIKKEVLPEKFNLTDELVKVEQTLLRAVSRFVNDLYIKADVEDNRYLFF